MATVTCTENYVKLGCVGFATHERRDRRTDRHTNALIAILRILPGAK